MTRSLRTLFAAVALALLSAVALVVLARPAHAAGRVEVNFVQPEAFADAGRPMWERERVLRSLEEHLKQLGSRLPDGQTLRLEVLDVDLAGTQELFVWHDVRVLRGGADAPRITVRWTLEQGGQVMRSATDEVADLGYSTLIPRMPPAASDLPYEKRMLSAWFAERFVSAGPMR